MNNTESQNTPPEEIKKKKKAHLVTLFILLTIFFILVPSGLYIKKYLKDRSFYMAYQIEAAETLGEFSKLSVYQGDISFDKYKKELEGLKRRVSAFSRKHEKYNTGTPPFSYKSIDYNFRLHLGLADKWDSAIRSGNSKLLSFTIDYLKKGWPLSKQHIGLTLQLMQETTREDFLKILEELESLEKSWGNEKKEYENQIESF